ncbi:MAG: glycosyltransferase family A protein [Cyanobacteriota bacterium]|nr:glycosyltransferase family A protein [Cyanobacteriota bacterium]
MPSITSPKGKPLFSVIVGRVSTEDSRRVLETLEALSAQQGIGPYEVILSDRIGGPLGEEIERRFPDLRRLAFPAETTLPQLRAGALMAASGRYIAVTEDHCIPPSDWLASFAQEFAAAPDGTIAIGGAVENGVADSGFDNATFLCEYFRFLAPLAGAGPDAVPGMNVAYERQALLGVDPHQLESDFWEAGVHQELARRGRFIATDRVHLRHAKRFRAGFFLQQRYHYSRHYAGRRFLRASRSRRLVACLSRLALPPLLLARISSHVLPRPVGRRALPAALPWLSLFILVWMAGEMAGCLAGPGDALRRIE